MTVKELRELIADWPDDENVLVWDYRSDMYRLFDDSDIKHSKDSECTYGGMA